MGAAPDPSPMSPLSTPNTSPSSATMTPAPFPNFSSSWLCSHHSHSYDTGHRTLGSGFLPAPHSGLSLSTRLVSTATTASRSLPSRALGTLTAPDCTPPPNRTQTMQPYPPESIFHKAAGASILKTAATLALLVFGHPFWLIHPSHRSPSPPPASWSTPTHSSFPEGPSPSPPQTASQVIFSRLLPLCCREPTTLCRDISFLMIHLTFVSLGTVLPRGSRPICLAHCHNPGAQAGTVTWLLPIKGRTGWGASP